MKALILMCLLMPLSVAAQTSNVVRDYDRFEDRTRYWTLPINVRPDLDLTVHFSFKGKGAGHDIEGFYLIFSSVSSDWQYLKNSRLYCLIDGQNLDLGSALARDNDVSTGYSSVEVKERLMFRLKYQTLEKMVKAKRLEMRLGNTEFSLSKNFQDSVAELLNKVKIVK